MESEEMPGASKKAEHVENEVVSLDPCSKCIDKRYGLI